MSQGWKAIFSVSRMAFSYPNTMRFSWSYISARGLTLPLVRCKSSGKLSSGAKLRRLTPKALLTTAVRKGVEGFITNR